MSQRYGVALAKRLQYAVSRGVLKVKIDAAERQIARHEQPKSGFRELDGFPAEREPLVSTSGGGCSKFTTTSSRFASKLESMDTLCCSSLSASRSRPELNSYFARVSRGMLIPHGGFAAQGGRAAFSSEARANMVASEAVRGQGVRDGSVAKNLTRWMQQAGQEKSQSMLMYLIAMVVAVVGFTYASVPLYRRFCAATGYGGTVQRREAFSGHLVVGNAKQVSGRVSPLVLPAFHLFLETVEEKMAKHASEDAATSRELVVHFNADVADSMPWKFTPCQNQVKVKVGQSSLAFYTAENTSSEDITGVSTYNVAPMQAGAYFNKIQCFCFEEQRIRAGEKIDMPVLFYIDPEFATDPKMDTINSLILSYTFFKVDDEAEE